MAWTQVLEWPELSFATIEPVQDKDCLLHLAAALESDRELHPRDRYFAAAYLRRVAENQRALNALSHAARGRRAGRAFNRAMHYAVCKELRGNARTAAAEVARVWNLDPHSVQDDKLNGPAAEEVASIVRLRLAGPSYHPNEEGRGTRRTWTRRGVLKAMDAELRRRAIRKN
jgi:hypothetical protein